MLRSWNAAVDSVEDLRHASISGWIEITQSRTSSEQEVGASLFPSFDAESRISVLTHEHVMLRLYVNFYMGHRIESSLNKFLTEIQHLRTEINVWSSRTGKLFRHTFFHLQP